MQKMIKKIKRVTLIIIGAVLLFLIITNPSMKRFREFNDSSYTQRRVSNYIIFSVYETTIDRYIGGSGTNQYVGITDKYVGIAYNFFKIDSSPGPPFQIHYYHSPD